MKKILLTGANGMLGTDFIKHFGEGFTIFSLDKDNGDITDMGAMDKLIKEEKPDILLNLAAYTNVDDAEDIGKKNNFDVNTIGVYNLAKLSAKYKIDFITISTDYVFDGEKEGYTEKDIPNPINNYGMAKYLGECLAKQENPDSIIIRTSWLFGGGNKFKNFVNTILQLSTTKKKLDVVNDQFGSPTYTVDLCEAIVTMLDKIREYKGAMLHLCNQTEGNGISRFEFAKEICKVAGRDTTISPCDSEKYKTKAKRPRNSKLLNASTIPMPPRKNGLEKYMQSQLE